MVPDPKSVYTDKHLSCGCVLHNYTVRKKYWELEARHDVSEEKMNIRRKKIYGIL